MEQNNGIRQAFRAVATVLLLCGAMTTVQAQFDRPWRVYFIPFSHTDVGYTAPVAEVLENHLRYLDTVVVWVARTRNNVPGEQFRWTIEIPWVLDTYVKQRSPAQVESLMACVRRGEIEIGGLYFGLQADLCGNEELVRSLSFSQEMRQAHGVPVRTALINDTPGFTWSLSQLLPKAGIPYLSVAMNSFLSDFYTTTSLPNLFSVQAQSGEKTLVWRSIDPTWAYLEGSATCAVYAGGPAIMQTHLTSFLQNLANSGYPYNEVLINCATGDNGAPNLSIVSNVHDWNGTFPNARIQISTASAFFDTMVALHGTQIPTYSGDAPNWWTWLFAPSATAGNALSRRAHLLLPAAETFAAVASFAGTGFSPGPATMRNAYIDNLTFEDHNLGSNYPGGDEPFWVLKMGWINAALDTGTSVLNRAIDAIGLSISTGATPAIAVFNPLGWNRSIPVTLTLGQVAALGVFDIQDGSTGEMLALQTMQDGSVCFLAPDVPPVGYSLFHAIPKAGTFPAPSSLAGYTLENRHFRVALDPVTGGVFSLAEKRTDREVVSQAGRFNQYSFNGTYPPAGMVVLTSDSGSVVQRLTLQGTARGTGMFQTTAAIYEGISRVDMHNVYDKLVPTSTETVDFNFSFAVPSPQMRYEIPFGNVRLFDDELSGFRTKHYALRQWLNVASAANDFAAVLAVEDASVTGHPSGTFGGDVRVMVSFNDANSAYRAGTGILSMDFSLTTTAGFHPDSAMRHAYSFSAPAPVRILPAGQNGTLTGGKYSFLRIIPESIFLSTVKTPLSGIGWVVRLYNPLDRTVPATLVFSNTVLSASETSLLEVDGPTLPAGGDSVLITMGPHEVKTVRVSLGQAAAVGGPAEMPVDFSLGQNFPNPFNPATTIQYAIGSVEGQALGTRNVRLTIYDLLGREVRVLVDGEQAPGNYEVRVDAAGLSSGVYFYRLHAGRFVETRKMMLTK